MKKIYVVGIGPGNKENMSFKAFDVLTKSDAIIGYKTYIDLIKEDFKDKELISSGMRKEVERCKEVIEIAKTGKIVSLISSGDAGIYGMAGIMLELVPDEIEIEIIPGITASNAAASIVGAPLMHDNVNISLSDLLTDWELIKKKINLAAEGDFVISFYNPKSKTRISQIEEAREILLKYKNPKTPVAIVRNAKREDESFVITDIENMLNFEIDMLSILIIGNSKTFVKNNKMITPRGYSI